MENLRRINCQLGAGFSKHWKSGTPHFDELGCRASDHGLDQCTQRPHRWPKCRALFDRARLGEALDEGEVQVFRRLCFTGWRFWTIGAAGSSSSIWVRCGIRIREWASVRSSRRLCSIGDTQSGIPAGAFLDRLDETGQLVGQILYNVNPAFNTVICHDCRLFPGRNYRREIQWGPAWWFLSIT